MRKEKKSSNFKRIVLIICITITVILAGIFITFGIFYNKYHLDVQKLTSVNNGVKVYSSSGTDTTLYNTNRSVVEIESLPQYVIQAFVDTEDKRFYQHNGYDTKRIIKAFAVNFKTGSKAQGASTITQQLIKNALLSNKKTYSRKIEEIMLAIKLEKIFTKAEIMEMYLNTIYFGCNSYGIENASKTYFNKSAKDLSLSEACCLAGLIKSPTYYSPRNNYDNAIKRRNLVAQLMLNNNHISKDEYNSVVASNINVIAKNNSDHSYEEEAIFEACTLLNLSERELINKKYQIITFKDDKMQNEIIKINNQVISTAETDYKTNLDSISILVNSNNQVVAYYVNSNYNLHNMKRQPASILKPFSVYLPAISHNILSPADKILDEEINYKGFSPSNADNKFHGYVSARTALAKSLNIPCVKILDCLGVKKAQQTLSNFGINIQKEDLNLALALGAVKNGVSIFDIVSAYSALANYGNYRQISFVNKILDEHGNIIYSYDDYSEKVEEEANCYILTDMLKGCASGGGTAARFEALNLPIASKTGTAYNGNSNTDLYNVAYTTEHTMLSWIANISDNKLPNNMLSSSQPTEINKQICSYLYPNSVADFKKPKGVIKLPYDLLEYDTNQIVVQPNHKNERYIAYDIFKEDNQPKQIEHSINLPINVNIIEKQAEISFTPNKSEVYNLYKKADNKLYLLATIKDSAVPYVFIDYDLFKYEEIEYFIQNDCNAIVSEICKIKPKDYLVNKLNNEIFYGKNKWYI